MANPEHVEIVKRGAKAIVEWRKENRGVRLDLSEGYLSRANLAEGYLSGANLSRANLSEANLSVAKLRRADLSKADLSRADLSGADLSGVDLSLADLRKADLRGADLRKADLRNADVREANLHGANLVSSDLRRVDLSRANLSEADLGWTQLCEAKVSGVNLNNSSFKDAQIGWTVFADVDLSVAKELETIKHDAPSAVTVDTMAKSKGRIPDEFLRGCGFAPWQILDAKMYDLAMTAAEIAELQYKIFDKRASGPLYVGGVFISYSRDDEKFVDAVYERLQKAGASVWLDRHNMLAGPLQKQVSRAIRLNDVVLLVLSEASVNSDWVENELEMARRKEKDENRDALCPVALDEAWKTKLDHGASERQLWRTLTRKNILDFSGWDTDAVFDEQFGKLLRGLKIYYEPKKA